VYIVMEYFREGDLFALVWKAPPGEDKAREYLTQIVRGLAALKNAQIAHR
jgi:serine/threonine protein kinase